MSLLEVVHSYGAGSGLLWKSYFRRSRDAARFDRYQKRMYRRARLQRLQQVKAERRAGTMKVRGHRLHAVILDEFAARPARKDAE